MAYRPGGLPKQFLDICVIYPSPNEKDKWVAHGIETDQIGVGDCVLNAYVDLCRAVRALVKAAAEDSSIQVFTPAPASVRKRLMHARKLPDQIVEIAEMQLSGQFRAILEEPWKPPVKAQTLSASIPVYA